MIHWTPLTVLIITLVIIVALTKVGMIIWDNWQDKPKKK